MLPSRSRAAAAALLLGASLAVAACGGDRDDARGAPEVTRDTAGAPDALPAIKSPELPFQYPPALYDQRVQANVMLRLFVDSLGHVVPESTQIAERSGYRELDSAAVSGARELEFTPARQDGALVGVTVLLPVHFRHPALGAASGAAGAAGPDTAGGGTQ